MREELLVHMKEGEIVFQGPWKPGQALVALRLIEIKAVPRYGWNPLRWLFRRPTNWEVVARFEALNRECPGV